MTVSIHRASDLADLLGSLTPTAEQAAVIEAPLEPLLVVAGAGSGKTATMTQRVLYLVATGQVDPQQILGLTFTRKAAGELEARVATQLDLLSHAIPALADINAPTVSTYNAFAAQIVADFGMLIGVAPGARLIGEAERFQIVRDLVDRGACDLAVTKSLDTLTGDVIGLAEQLANHRVLEDAAIDRTDPEALGCALADTLREHAADIAEQHVGRKGVPATIRTITASLELRAQLLPLVSAYARYKREHQLLDFSDQILFGRALVGIDSVREAVAGRYRAIFLDEFQDTSEGQIELLAGLFKGLGVTAVGDPNQAIYSWRGASSSALHGFHRHFGGTTSLTLSTAWRNDAAILEVANEVARPLSDTPDYWRDKAREAAVPTLTLQPRPGAGPGEILAGRYAAALDEADAIADYLDTHWDRSETCAILVRTRRHIPLLAEKLRARAIPVVLDAAGLLEQPHIIDVCAALHVTADAARGDHLMRLLTNIGVGVADIEVLWRWAGERARSAGEDPKNPVTLLLDAVDSPPEVGWGAAEYPDALGLSAAAHARVRQLGARLRELRRYSTQPLPRLVTRAIELLGTDLDAIANANVPLAARDFQAFIGVAESFGRSADRPGLHAFLAWIEAARVSERGLAQAAPAGVAGACTITTVHAAKGLEWDTVVVPFLAAGTFPTRPRGNALLTADAELPGFVRSDGDYLPDLTTEQDSPSACHDHYKDAEKHRHLLEERRLAYVALTRARSRLVLTTSWFPSAAGTGTKAAEPSPFWPSRPLTPLPSAVPQTDTADDALAQIAARAPAAHTGLAGEPRLFRALRASAQAVEGSLAEWGGGDLQLSGEDILALTQGTREPTDTVSQLIAEGRDAPPEDPVGQAVRVIADQAAAGSTETVRLPRRLTTTALARLDNPQELATYVDWLRRPVPTTTSPGAALGTLLHEAMALIVTGMANGGEVTRLREIALERLSDAEPTTIDAVTNLIDRALATGALQQGRPIDAEYDVSMVVDDTVIAARLDALLREGEDGRFVIVDWKTDAPGASARVNPAYVWQQQIYRLALADTLGLDPADIAARLVYVRDAVIVDIDEVSRLSPEEVRRSLADTLRAGQEKVKTVYVN